MISHFNFSFSDNISVKQLSYLKGFDSQIDTLYFHLVWILQINTCVTPQNSKRVRSVSIGKCVCTVDVCVSHIGQLSLNSVSELLQLANGPCNVFPQWCHYSAFHMAGTLINKLWNALNSAEKQNAPSFQRYLDFFYCDFLTESFFNCLWLETQWAQTFLLCFVNRSIKISWKAWNDYSAGNLL